jgi:DNA polymerase-3 subunit epsilon
MLENIKLTRPLAFIDLETTGLNRINDRIVEISIVKVFPDHSTSVFTKRINPGMPIPPGATAIHHIADEDVADEPKFGLHASAIIEFLAGADLAGFNIIRFDLPFLAAEFDRVHVDFSYRDRHIVDCQVLYHMKEPRNLAAAYSKYCNKEMETAHTAEGDARVSAEVLGGQINMYSDFPRDVESLHKLCDRTPENAIDPEGKFVLVNGAPVCNFGQTHNGRTLDDIYKSNPEYLIWILRQAFSPEVKKLVKEAFVAKK